MKSLEDKIAEAKYKAQKNERLISKIDNVVGKLDEHIDALKRADELRQRDIAKTDDTLEQLKTALTHAKSDLAKQTDQRFEQVTEAIEKTITSVAEFSNLFTGSNKNLVGAVVSAINDIKVEVKHPDVNVEVPAPVVVYQESIKDKYLPADSDQTTQNEYHGHLALDGSWYIEKVSHDDVGANYRYKTGKRNYENAWAKRQSGNYKRINNAGF